MEYFSPNLLCVWVRGKEIVKQTEFLYVALVVLELDVDQASLKLTAVPPTCWD